MFCLSKIKYYVHSMKLTDFFNSRLPIRVFDIIITLLFHERFLLTFGMVLMRFLLATLMFVVTFTLIFLSILLTHFLWNSGF